MSHPSAPDSLPRGLTLIELLVAVAILGVLAAVALPNVLEARTRARVVRARNDLRVVAGGLEAYHVDYGEFPTGRATPGSDPYGVFARYALGQLTTPIAYVDSSALQDVFGPILPAIALLGNSARPGGGFPFPTPPSGSSLLFFNYDQFGAAHENSRIMVHGFAIVSVGPDRRDSFSVYYPFPDEFPQEAINFGIADAGDTLYDPTNGTISAGDIARWGGDLPPMRQP